MDYVQSEVVDTQPDVIEQGLITDQYNTEGSVCHQTMNFHLIQYTW